MRCPVDDAPLREVTRRGVKIDLCSECRGIWLDRGELEHLLEAADTIDETDARGAAAESRLAAYGDDARRGEPRREERRSSAYDRRDDDDDGRRSPKKKRSWLSELLEFGED